ncbi:glycerophosphodiester phosphodiesterase family protein [Brachybacterium sp. YJGR34]|uniref:glycerophosphodiester phosphodiesterase family protein n=1 Tax=Brachybacterium sp. YJGR34 TaxID=2059911 RepID=UPI000E0B1675|nr:glycerophosphodiester phosphodiesterase family protein [Brachybacterium sp. YJGR34]
MTSRAALRAAFDDLLDTRGAPLVIAHRGTSLGSAPDNTVHAAIGAVRSGADVVELDVLASADGVPYLFHHGYEAKHFGRELDLRSMPAAEIDELRFLWQGGVTRSGPDRLADLLEALPDVWLNIDRSWGLWPGLLDVLAPHADRVLLKSPPLVEPLAALADHPVPFLYFPIVRTPEQLAEVEAIDGLHLIGAELLAAEPTDPFADPARVAEVAARHPLVLLNALNLENGARLHLEHSDDVSLREGGDAGWGHLVDVGATAIQTDWPHLLRGYLADRGLRG